jgi:hypothetical protein
MKRQFALLILFTATALITFAQPDTKEEEGKIIRDVLAAARELSSTLTDSCLSAMFIIEFVLGEKGQQIDSVRVIASDSRYASFIDKKKLAQIPVAWSLLLNKPSLSKGAVVILPVLIMLEQDECGQVRVAPREILDVFTHLQLYTNRLNESAFLLKMMDITTSRVSCGFIQPRPIVQTATPPPSQSESDH